jgi:hypothetical protein
LDVVREHRRDVLDHLLAREERQLDWLLGIFFTIGGLFDLTQLVRNFVFFGRLIEVIFLIVGRIEGVV